jgi:hypothetical protein
MLILSKPAAAGPDPATTAWVNAVVTAGGTVSSPQQTLVNDLIVGLKADGVWAKLDRLWLFAAENEISALIDLVALVQANTVGTLTFTGHGCVGGADGFIRTLFNASTQGVQWTSSSSHIAAWDNTSRAATATAITGVADDFSVSDLMPFYTSGVVVRINSGLTSFPSATNSTSRGFFIGQRNNNTTTECFYNGASLGTAGNSRNTIVNLEFYICARNDNGGEVAYTTDQISMISYGGNFTSAEALAYYNRLVPYMEVMGVLP